MKNRWARWISAILLWRALGGMFALPGLSSGSWRRILLGSFAQWWSWGLATPLILWIDKRLPFKENQLVRRVLAHLPVSVALTVLYRYAVTSMGVLFGLQPWRVMARPRFLASIQGLLWSWLVYRVIFGVQLTFRCYQHDLASELRPART
jgi:two-component system, LytTR family, sensor kinase